MESTDVLTGKMHWQRKLEDADASTSVTRCSATRHVCSQSFVKSEDIDSPSQGFSFEVVLESGRGEGEGGLRSKSIIGYVRKGTIS